MDNIPTVKLAEMFDKKYAISLEDAEKLYSILKTSLDEKKKVIISFEGIELLITAFLNASFGKLFKDYAEKDIDYLCQLSVQIATTINRANVYAEILKHTKELMELNQLEFEPDGYHVMIRPNDKLKLVA